MDKQHRSQLIGELFHQVNVMHRKVMREHVKLALEALPENNLALHHPLILKILADNGALQTTELSNITGISKSQMTASINSLIKEGLVERQHDENDRRVININLTEKGYTWHQKFDDAFIANFDGLIQTLSHEEQEQLTTALQTVTKIMFKLSD